MYLPALTESCVRSQRTRAAILSRGVTANGAPLWTEFEDEKCRALYPDYKALAGALPGRSHFAIRYRCRFLGIVNKKPQWSGSDQVRFRRMFKTSPLKDLQEAFPNRSAKSLTRRGYELGLKRPEVPYAPTGDALLDALRSECRQQKLTMADLDDIVRSKPYFRQSCWQGNRGRYNYNVILKAIRKLGGDVRVEWSGK